LICIKGYTGFKYRGFRQQGRSGWNSFGDWGGAQVQRRQGEHVRGQFWSETGTGSELDWSWLTGNWERVMDRT